MRQRNTAGVCVCVGDLVGGGGGGAAGWGGGGAGTILLNPF